MYTCDEHHADLIIDGTHYRLETLSEIKHFCRLAGSSGVKFVNLERTRLRLESAHAEAIRARKQEEKAAARVAHQAAKVSAKRLPNSGRA